MEDQDTLLVLLLEHYVGFMYVHLGCRQTKILLYLLFNFGYNFMDFIFVLHGESYS